MQSADSMKTYAYWTKKDLESEKEEIKCNNIIKRYKKTFYFEDFIKENLKKHNTSWPRIPNHPYRILITGGSEFGKKNYLI